MTIGTLICGQPSPDWSAKDTFDHYTTLLNKFHEKLKIYRGDLNQSDASLFAAFCARVILENASAIISGRLDPFRLMAVRNFQSQDDFDHGRALKIGYKWSPDIVPIEQTQDIWKKDIESSKLSRSLFSNYFEELFWKPAFVQALDFVDSNNLERTRLLGSMEPERFIGRTKSELGRLYSLLSKGVHWDYLTPQAMLDPETLAVALDDCEAYVCLLAFVSHFIPTAYGSIDRSEAYTLYRNI